jgi:hypothetical protein
MENTEVAKKRKENLPAGEQIRITEAQPPNAP